MQRYSYLVLSLSIWVLPLQGALPSNTTTFEVRPTVGSNNNGGCFITGGTGTDFSQQDSAQYTFTDLVLVSTTTMSSASHVFVSTDVDNCIHITAGTNFTVGFYRILSVAVGVATVDRGAGTMGSTGGTFAVGGAVADVATTLVGAVGSTSWVKATGSLTVAATTTFSTNSSGGNPIRITGYTTTRGDGGRFTWTTATNSVNLVTTNGATGLWFQNINFTNTAGTRGIGIRQTGTESNEVQVINCILDGMSRGISAAWIVESSDIRELVVQNSEVKNSTTQGIEASAFTMVYGSYIHDNTGNGLSFNANANGAQTGMVVGFTIVKSNTSSGLLNAYTGGITSISQLNVFNSIFMLNGADGIRSANLSSNSLQVYNSLFDTNTGFGINAQNSGNQLGTCIVVANGFFGNTTAAISTSVPSDCISGSVTLTGSPFTNAAGNNFALNNTAGAGAAAKATGFPGVLTIGGTGYMDIGPLQSQTGASSGGGSFGFVQ